jgi:protein-S-isoprenylcysteine O-methyltransferase Ste14
MITQDKHGPGVYFPPPLVFLIAIALGYWLESLYSLMSLDSYFWILIGSTGIILCIGVLLYGLYSFFKAKTHIEPWQPASHLITTGLYRYSRNPLYLTFFVFTLCLGMVLSNTWMMLLAFPAIWIIKITVITKEEAYLEAKFSDKYIKYKRQVSRWL